MASNRHPSESGIWHRIALVILGVALASPPSILHGQQKPPRKAPPGKVVAKPAATPPAAELKLRGIWEPVNYKQDLQLADVFFVSADVGWVSGAAGTILHTTDGGVSWTVQLGGDPHSQEDTVWGLDFVDETHGWARMGDKLLRTTDGETWEQIGSVYGGYGHYIFTSQTTGVYVLHAKISQTVDAGKTWKEVFTCRTKLEVEGLMREDSCYRLSSVHFPSPTVGYAVSAEHALGAVAVAKTEDGGATWSVTAVRDAGSAEEVFFTDESTGFVILHGGKVIATTDGGRTWRGLAGVLPSSAPIKFADPEVGWSWGVYTTDGGKRWGSFRGTGFPATARAFSLPRRDRGYLVGDHGMIYRYRVVPLTEAIPRAIEEAAMPSVDAALATRAEQIQTQVQALQEEISKAQPASATAGAADSGGEGGFVQDCCSEKLNQLESTADSFAAELPKFSGKYRNLNLIFSGLRLVSQLFGQAQSLKDSFSALKKARDPQSVSTALSQLTGQVEGLVSNTKAAFQSSQ